MTTAGSVRIVSASARLTLAILLVMPGAARGDPGIARALIESRCVGCHRGKQPEGGVSLHRLELPAAGMAGPWPRILRQLVSGAMPPEGEPRPSLTERLAAVDEIAAALAAAGIELGLSGPAPADGNFIDHELLFSAAAVSREPPASPPRFWRRSQPEYDSLMEHLWVIPVLRYEKAHARSDSRWAAYGYSRPFPALDPVSFSNYSGLVHADEATLRALMDAGGQIAERLTTSGPAFDKQNQPPHSVGIPIVRRGSKWERFLRKPPSRPPEFEPFVEAPSTTLPDAAQQRAAVDRVFRLLLRRPPDGGEASRYGQLLRQVLERSGALAALRGLIVAVVISPEFVYRMELGLGPVDEHGRRMLSASELVHALAHALTDGGPDRALQDAAREGRLTSASDVEREARRILTDTSVEKHRVLRFFQEFFGYQRAVDVFKDHPGWYREVSYLVRDADLLVEHVLEKDRDVLTELLTTDRYFVAFPVIRDPELFEAVIQNTREETLAAIERQKQRGKKIGPHPRGNYSRAWILTRGLELIPRTVHNDPKFHETSYIRVYGFDGNEFSWSRQQPIEVPGRRAGILTHPAWLVAHSTNTDNDVVRRGRWIRERLLAGAMPDVPLDVEARVPDEPDRPLRQRMRVTREPRCLPCHRRMDPLGFPFEMYDHYGRYRTEERVGARKKKTLAVDASGAITASGEPGVDGDVGDAIELVHRLARSTRARQSFVRHAFRFWMGRNETLADAPTLRDADRAYVESDGSFRELLVALLTSDSFLYRK